MSSQSTTRTSSPCGCGGGSHSHASKSGCGCGGGCGCGTGDCHGGSYVRPRFFAGQLLTEEDLQALGEYVVAKNRLHNRHFFGEGVVCGLEVTCHPCGGGQVTVHPGHALDCCGNDIVLSCPRTLDVNGMVRDLRQRLLGGYDCGDPCAPPQPGKERQKTESRRYCLYVRYCEDLTDPVSPYATDEPCGSGGCEPTRVREGLRFELRCGEEAAPPAGMIDRVLACLGDVPRIEKTSTDLLAVDRIDRQSAAALALDRSPGPFETAALARSVEAVESAAGAAAERPSGDNVRRVFSEVAVLTRHVERFNALGEAEREELRERQPEVGRTLARVVPALTQVQRSVVPRLAETAPTLLERSYARSVFERAGSAASTASSTGHVVAWSDQSVPVLNGQLDNALCDLREALLDRLDGSPDLARCELRRRVKEIDVQCAPGSAPAGAPARSQASRQIVEVWVSYLQDCVCRALLPPCPPCEDPGVLLACLDVQDCEVVKICNLERTFVLTPVALRHWLPLHWVGEVLERLCCMDFRIKEGRESFDVQAVALRSVLLTRTRLSDTDLPRLGTAASAMFALAEENGAPFLDAARVSRARTVEAPPPPAPAPDPEELVRTVEERLDLASLRKMEKTQKKSAEDLKGLQRELQKQIQRNADLERRLKTLEEART
jgi:hypothetical protein